MIDPLKDWLLWDSFVKIHRSDDLIVLVTAAWIFVILPRQFFKSDREWKILQDMVLSKVKEVIGGLVLPLQIPSNISPWRHALMKTLSS